MIVRVSNNPLVVLRFLLHYYNAIIALRRSWIDCRQYPRRTLFGYDAFYVCEI